MTFPDLCEIFDLSEQRDGEGRIIKAMALRQRIEGRIAPLSLARRQREYGEELQATHEGQFPVRAALTATSEVRVVRAASDPGAVGVRLRVKAISKPYGRYWQVALAPAPQV